MLNQSIEIDISLIIMRKSGRREYHDCIKDTYIHRHTHTADVIKGMLEKYRKDMTQCIIGIDHMAVTSFISADCRSRSLSLCISYSIIIPFGYGRLHFSHSCRMFKIHNINWNGVFFVFICFTFWLYVAAFGIFFYLI